MKTTIETKAVGTIVINSKFIGNKAANWDSKAGIKTNYNNHKVTVSCNGKRTSFDFWGSLNDPQIKTDSENMFALYCFLSDSISGKESFEDFCSEFGYDEDSRSAERTHRACEKSCDKAERLFSDLYELINEIQETYDC